MRMMVAAITLLALASPACAAHTWYYVDFDTPKDERTCQLSKLTPEQYANEIGLGRIPAANVIKDDDGIGVSSVLVGKELFFTNRDLCEDIAAAPSGRAPSHDIN
jgi:hypothetical protein